MPGESSDTTESSRTGRSTRTPSGVARAPDLRTGTPLEKSYPHAGARTMAGAGERMSSRHQTLLAVLLGVGAGGCLGPSETISRDGAVGWKSVASDAAISDSTARPPDRQRERGSGPRPAGRPRHPASRLRRHRHGDRNHPRRIVFRAIRLCLVQLQSSVGRYRGEQLGRQRLTPHPVGNESPNGMAGRDNACRDLHFIRDDRAIQHRGGRGRHPGSAGPI